MSRFAKFLIAVLVLIVIAVAGVIVFEFTMRKVVPEQFKQHAREFLHLTPDHPVDVQLQGFMTEQLIRGRFDSVQITIPDVPLKDGMRAKLSARAESMPINPTTGEIIGAEVTATFTEEQLADVIRFISRGAGQDVSIESGGLTISNSISVFGQQIPIKLTFVPEARDGALHIAPTGLEAAGFIELTPQQLTGVPFLGDVVDGFDVCVADKLPRGVTLEDIVLSTAQTLSVTVSLDERIGLDERLQEFGSCG